MWLDGLVVRALDSRLDVTDSMVATREFDSRPSRLYNNGMGDRLRAGKTPKYFAKPPRPTQPPTLSGTGNEYQLKCGEPVMFSGWRVKAGMAYSTCR